MCGHRASLLASCAAPCGGPPSLTWQAGPGSAFLSPPSDKTSRRAAFIGNGPVREVQPGSRCGACAICAAMAPCAVFRRAHVRGH
jgi:hypothetical protein